MALMKVATVGRHSSRAANRAKPVEFEETTAPSFYSNGMISVLR